ncbi:unnamed protein product [Phytomonas sp. EM1]|nr:unnamed protein product [Phytomonas sp. EM1]|eukprot:CCW63092.1 unnamed protein product [Phytomonas sp. isolate EM1]
MVAWCDSFTYRPFPLLQQMRLYHPGSSASPTHNDTGRTPTEEIPSSRFMEIFLDATRAHSLDSEPPNVGSFYSRLFSPAKKGSHSVDGFPEAPVANSALHYFPNASVASLFIIRPRADGVFEIPEEVHEEKGGGSGLRTRPFRTPLDAVKALPPLLREAAAQEAISRAQRSSTRVDARGASQPSDGDVAARLHPAFIRSVLEQAFLRLYLRPLEGGEGNSRPVEAASSPSSHRVRSDGKGRAFYAHVYPLCTYDALPRALREALERGLAAVWLSSAFSFHVAWAWLLGRGYGRLALELFMLWGWANPDSIVVEQAQRLLPTTYPTWKGGLLVEKGANRLVGLRAIALQLHSHVAGMSDSELRTAHLCGGFLTTTLMYPKGYLEALATHLGAQLPYKKYYVTCALLPQVLKAAARLSDMTFSAKPGKRSEPGVERNHRERPAWPPPRYDRGAEIFQELMREWVLPVLCPSQRLPSLLQPQRGNLASSVEFSSEEIGYDPYTERCEEWIVLACTLAAIGLLEGYVVASRRAHAIRAVSTIRNDPSNYEDPHPRVPDEHEQKVVEPTPLLEATLLDILRERYLAWAWSLVSSRLSTDANSLEMLQARTRVEDWARVIFSTVFDGFHASGVFHPAPTRRPITACGVWRRLHDALLGKFPHVFHGGSTVATLWVLMTLEGMSTHLPCGPLPVSFFGKEEALIAWRRVAGFGGGWEVSTRDFHHRARNPAAEEAMEYWKTSGSGYQPREERQRRMEFLLAGIATAGEEAGGGGGAPHSAGEFLRPPSILRLQSRSLGFPRRPGYFRGKRRGGGLTGGRGGRSRRLSTPRRAPGVAARPFPWGGCPPPSPFGGIHGRRGARRGCARGRVSVVLRPPEAPSGAGEVGATRRRRPSHPALVGNAGKGGGGGVRADPREVRSTAGNARIGA